MRKFSERQTVRGYSQKLNYLALSDGEIEGFAQTLASYLPPEVVASGGIPAGVESMLASLDELADPEVAKKRAAEFGTAYASQMAERILFRDGIRVGISGQRFRALDKNFPFVRVHLNFFPSEKDILELREKVAVEYSRAPVKGFTIQQRPSEYDGLGHEKWSHTLFGRIEGLKESTLPRELRVEWNKLDFYDSYQEEYHRLLSKVPEVRAYLGLEDKKDLQAAAEKGLLLTVSDAHGWVGAVAGQQEDFYGFPCVYIFELFVSERWRGRRIARPMQSQFLCEISSRFPYVYGFINNANQPSLRTALSLGRKVVETEYFFSLA